MKIILESIKTKRLLFRKQLRISPQKISAYKIGEDDKDTLKDIVDQTSGLIESIEIDTISQEINEESDKLDILEMKYDL